MKKIILLILLLLTLFGYSQRWEMATGVHYVNTEGQSITFRRVNNYLEYKLIDADAKLFCIFFGGGLNLPIYSFSDEMNIGIQANALVSTVASASNDGLSGPGFNFNTSGYLAYNYGAASSYETEMPIGFGFGLGYQYSFYMIDNLHEPGDNGGLYSYATPTFMAQVSNLWLFSNLIIRYEVQLGGNRYLKNDVNGHEFGYNFMQQTISIIVYTNRNKNSIKY